MEKTEKLKHFYSNYVLMEGWEQIEKLYHYCKEKKEELCDRIWEGMKLLSKEIKEKQEKGEKEEILCIGIFLLRSDIYRRNGKIRIYAMDKNFYLDRNPIWVEIQAEELFQFLWEFEDYLLQNAKKYVGKITEDDIRNIILQEYTPYFIPYINEISRLAMRSKKIEIWKGIKKQKGFFVISGEYKGKFDEIFITEVMEEDENFYRLLRKQKENKNEFFCKNYNQINLEKFDLEGINFTKSVFYQSKICNTNLEEAYLIKTRFLNCDLSDSILKGAFLLDADFSGSNLSNCNLENIKASITKPNIINLNLLSFIGADFRDTNLKNTKFKNASLKGADFQGAIFENTDFEGADLEETVFERKALERLKFSKEQREEILVVETK